MSETLIRRLTLPAIDATKERIFGGFAMSHSTEDEYAVTMYCPENELEDVLDELGFSPSMFSALKIRFDGNMEDGSWVWRKSLLADYQLHIVSHHREDSDGIDIYAHWERSTVTHPLQHYRKVEYDANAGIETVRDMLDSYRCNTDDPPSYEIHPPHRRSWAWALHLLSFVSTPTAVKIGRRFDRLSMTD